MSGRTDAASAYRRWYNTVRWRALRRMHLVQEPLCRMCLPRVVEAQAVDHIKPHKGNPDLFWNPDNLQSLCDEHHNKWKQAAERSTFQAIGSDGWPVGCQ